MNQSVIDEAMFARRMAGASAIGMLTSLLRSDQIPTLSKPLAEQIVRDWDEASARVERAIQEAA